MQFTMVQLIEVPMPASANNIMKPSVGAFYDATAMYYFSDCSIDAFKNTLLTPDRK